MASVKVEITGDARKLEQTFSQIEQGQKKVETGFDNVATSGKDSARKIEQGFAEIGESGKDSARQIEAANTAAATKGTASYNRILAELKRHGPEGRAQAKAIEEHLQSAGKAGRRSMNDVIQELGEFDDVAANVARNAIDDFDSVGNAGRAAFGESAIVGLTNFAAKWIAVAGAVDMVKSSIDAVRQAQQEAVDSLAGRQDGNRRLLQVTNNTEDFLAAQETADRLASTYGIGRDEARQLGFSAISAGFANDQDFIASNAQTLGIESQANVASIAVKTYADEGVKVDEAINAMLAAAAESVFNFEELSAGLPKLATRAKEAGSGFDETLGLLSAVADHLQSTDRAADRLGAFASAVSIDTGADAETDEEFAARRKAESLRARKANLDYAETQDRVESAKHSLKENDDPEREAALRRRLSAAEMQLEAFDKSTLKEQPLQRRQGRRSLAGLGLQEAERVLSDDYTEEQRRDFVGSNMALSEAVVALRSTRETALARTAAVGTARSVAGTDASLVAQKREAFEGDAASVAAREKLAADNRAEIEKERQLALDETSRQTRRQNQKSEEYKSGDSPVMVEGRAIVRGASDMTADAFDGAAQALFGWDKYHGLADDAYTASGQSGFGDDEKRAFEALGFAATSLGNQRRASPGEEVMLSVGDVQTFLATLSGELVSPDQITMKQQRALTNQINQLAGSEHASAGPLQKSFFDLIPGVTADTFGLNSKRPAELLSGIDDQSWRELLAETREANRLARESLSAMQSAAAAQQQTATNTKPRVAEVNSGDIIRASAAAADARAPR